jgi:multidrug efflux pump subunit AcrB
LVLGLVSGQVQTPEQIAHTVIKTNPAGIPVRIGDIAAIGAGVKPVYTLVTANGKPAVLLNVNRQPESNTLEVANEVHAQVEQIRKSLPSGVEIRPFYDQSIIVSDSIKSVRDAIIVGLILASIILVIFLRDGGSSIVAALVIPVTILVTFSVLKLMGQSFNLMTLRGLAAAAGLVIDDAIVVVENIALHREAGQDRLQAVHSALQEITLPLIGSTVTPVVVFLPLISITGVTVAGWKGLSLPPLPPAPFFRALAVTMGVSLFTSLALALTWTPSLSQYFIRKHGITRREEIADGSFRNQLLAAEEASLGGFFRKIIDFHQRWLWRALENRKWLAVISLSLIAISYICYRFSGSDLLPEMDEGGFTLDYWTPAGSSLRETDRMVTAS